LVKLVELLHDRPGADGEFLAKACEVSERTLQRDLDALGAAGFPVYFDQGYRLAAPALLPPVGLTVDEALALNLAAQAAIPRAEAAAAQALSTATRKLQQAMSAKPSAPSPDRQLALALPPGSDPRVEACVAALTGAIVERRTVRLTYQPDRRKSHASRLVDPYRLMPAEPGWDLLAYCHDRRRMLRIPLVRLAEVAVQRKKFAAMSERLLARHLHGDGAETLGLQWIRLLCRPPLAQTLLRHPPVGALLWEDAPEGGVVFTVGTLDPEEFVPWLLACGDAVEVLQPAEMRRRLRGIAQAIAARHAPETAGSRPPPAPEEKPPAATGEPPETGEV
jgi:predicted DNA-binding transcriptional regulator YafY